MTRVRDTQRAAVYEAESLVRRMFDLALATYDHAVLSLLGWQADALALFQAAAAQDAGLALAHAGAAVCLFLEERFAETKEAVRG